MVFMEFYHQKPPKTTLTSRRRSGRRLCQGLARGYLGRRRKKGGGAGDVFVSSGGGFLLFFFLGGGGGGFECFLNVF